ncbi:hypothetical protein MNB_SUP05-SYMBIONT-4-1002 [hydrothermal vent metagenome]|uniref:COGs COG2929 n=1 Tax=hydrothermal vent metagenome TaxID=652676 RepID=A0A1W1DYF6_9ZZZZ|nr:hypothetical protein [Gammaproteobacteria bacterium]
MEFEWDEVKSQQNQVKHGVDFIEAKEVFADTLQISKLDFRFNYFEERWITIGSTRKNKLLVVANLFFTEEGNEIIRIISARKANKKERSLYEKY